MLGLPVLAGIALAAVQALLTQLTVPGGISGFFGADDPFEQAGASLLVMYAVQLVLFTVVSSMLSGIIALAAVRSQLAHRSARESCSGWSARPCPRWPLSVCSSPLLRRADRGWGLAVFGIGAGADAPSPELRRVVAS